MKNNMICGRGQEWLYSDTAILQNHDTGSE